MEFVDPITFPKSECQLVHSTHTSIYKQVINILSNSRIGSGKLWHRVSRKLADFRFDRLITAQLFGNT